jgi:S-adenosylmethionine:tRNA ribosyltransferase-isomerase
MSGLSTDLFDYNLPDHLIAQSPTEQRGQSRLLVVDRDSRQISHRLFRDLPGLLRSGDTLIRNNAAVLPARIRGTRPTGGGVECFLLRPESTTPQLETWWCLLRPGKRLKPHSEFAIADAATARVVEKSDEGVALVEFKLAAAGDTMKAIANRCGQMPLPPYIKRAAGDDRSPADAERYQTVYANRARQVAVAAPTAGLHFTDAILAEIEQCGIATHEVTLHVGLGTFRPVTSEQITDHDIHQELYEMPADTQARLFDTAGGRRIAVGTTSVRAIEHFLTKHREPGRGLHLDEADIFIYPPKAFQGVDGLITNFHQPRSTLMCLVSAFLTPGSTEGIDWIRDIYQEAIAEEYRFFSYGDAMLIL